VRWMPRSTTASPATDDARETRPAVFNSARDAGALARLVASLNAEVLLVSFSDEVRTAAELSGCACRATPSRCCPSTPRLRRLQIGIFSPAGRKSDRGHAVIRVHPAERSADQVAP